MLQGFSSSLFHWDDSKQSFHVKNGIYVAHLSQMSLSGILSQFVYAATCLKLVELLVKKVEIASVRSPTLKAFANSVSVWLEVSVFTHKVIINVGKYQNIVFCNSNLHFFSVVVEKRLRDVALREEMKSVESDNKNSFTLLGLASTLSRFFL